MQTLHLGHTAKSFAMRESPSALRNYENVIQKIFNGEFIAKSESTSLGVGHRATSGSNSSHVAGQSRSSGNRSPAELKALKDKKKRTALRKRLAVSEHGS